MFVPWNEIPLCGAKPDAGDRTCLPPRCSDTYPDRCTLENGYVVCPCQ